MLDILKLIPLGLLIIGAFSCFFGFRLFRIAIASWGFLIAAVIAAVLSQNNLLVTLVAGIIGGAVLYFLYIFGIRLLGSALGIILALLIMTPFGIQSKFIFYLIVALFALLGIRIAFVLEKSILVLATGLLGAFVIVEGLLFLLFPQLYAIQKFQVTNALPPLGAVGWLVIGLAGIVFQYGGVNKARMQIKDMRQQFSDYKEKRKRGEATNLLSTLNTFLTPKPKDIKPVSNYVGWRNGVLALLLFAFAAFNLSDAKGSSEIFGALSMMFAVVMLFEFWNFRIYMNQVNKQVQEESGRYGKLGKL